MLVLLWLLEKLSPLINWLGIIGWIYVLSEEELVYLFCAIPLWIAGFIFGICTYEYGMPPRWLWTKSSIDIFDNKICNGVGYGWLFAHVLLGVVGIVAIINESV